jgi:hypothetical protein
MYNYWDTFIIVKKDVVNFLDSIYTSSIKKYGFYKYHLIWTIPFLPSSYNIFIDVFQILDIFFKAGYLFSWILTSSCSNSFWANKVNFISTSERALYKNFFVELARLTVSYILELIWRGMLETLKITLSAKLELLIKIESVAFKIEESNVVNGP